MLEPRELMRRHVEALFTSDEAGRLIAVNETGGAPAPRFFLGCTSDGGQCWFRHDVSPAVADELAQLTRAVEPHLPLAPDPDTLAPFAAVLEAESPIERTWSGPAFSFPSPIEQAAETAIITPQNAGLLERWLDEWLGDVREGLPLAAVVEDGDAVSLCCSVRVTDEAHEAGVETHPQFRGRGHAARATAAWAKLVRSLDREPLYSTVWENAASRSVARKLGLVQFGGDFHLT